MQETFKLINNFWTEFEKIKKTISHVGGFDGFCQCESEKVIEKMIEDRKIARQNKDFKKADEIRDKLKKMNISIDDTTEGTKWIVND